MNNGTYSCMLLTNSMLPNNLRSQEFLQGHDHRVSVVACSKSGKYLASGQLSHQGFSAAIIIWDLPGRKKLHEMMLHKVKVQALDFSCDDEYLLSTGGQDDCKIVAWRVSTGVAICGSPVPYDFATAVKFFNKDPHKFVTAGDMKYVVWKLDVPNRMLEPENCDVGRLRRISTQVVIDAKDEFMYVATHTGDVMRISLGPKLFRNGGPKPFIEQGVMSICSTQHGHLLAGGGDGSLTLLENETLRILERTQLAGAVSSVFLAETAGNSFACYAGTNMSNIFLIKYDGRKQKFMPPEVVQSCHYNKINDIAFPVDYSEVFATASSNDVRIWGIKNLEELLRIQVPNELCDYKDSANQECLCVAFMPDGKSIITGWADGKIRAFGPQTGKLQYTIVDAHSTAGKGVLYMPGILLLQ
ncbi:hypothetical protein R1flu_023658 [Riccia fluitans]|uniref:Cilia- and flagella-associated protein 52 n=1 Tax=Riccia fluitans TaxID=41844 RepID=A0ABD1XVN9_9MARC